jgi:hypothetical protein
MLRRRDQKLGAIREMQVDRLPRQARRLGDVGHARALGNAPDSRRLSVTSRMRARVSSDFLDMM